MLTGESLLENQDLDASEDPNSFKKLLLDNKINTNQRNFLASLFVFLILGSLLVVILLVTKKPSLVEVIHLEPEESSHKGLISFLYLGFC